MEYHALRLSQGVRAVNTCSRTTITHDTTMTAEASRPISEQLVLERLRRRIDDKVRDRKYPLIILKDEIREVVGIPFSEARPYLLSLYRSGLIGFGRTLNTEYFTLPNL